MTGRRYLSQLFVTSAIKVQCYLSLFGAVGFVWIKAVFVGDVLKLCWTYYCFYWVFKTISVCGHRWQGSHTHDSFINWQRIKPKWFSFVYPSYGGKYLLWFPYPFRVSLYLSTKRLVSVTYRYSSRIPFNLSSIQKSDSEQVVTVVI